MDDLNKLICVLWSIIEKNRECAINITNRENEIVVNILSGKKYKRFKNNNALMLINNLKYSYNLA